jgi:ribosomal protein L34E
LAKKKGDQYKCEDCGLILEVVDPCGCETTEIVCCGAPMKPVKETKPAKTTKAKAKPKPKK